MALLDEITNEIKGQKSDLVQAEVNKEKPKREKKEMTAAEREAYRQKKIREEEARYLKMSSTESGKTRGRPRKSDSADKKQSGDAPQPRKRRRRKTVAEPAKERQPRARQARQPKMIDPLQVLYLLKIPGLPKGDCIAICLARGCDNAQ